MNPQNLSSDAITLNGTTGNGECLGRVTPQDPTSWAIGPCRAGISELPTQSATTPAFATDDDGSPQAIGGEIPLRLSAVTNQLSNNRNKGCLLGQGGIRKEIDSRRKEESAKSVDPGPQGTAITLKPKGMSTRNPDNRVDNAPEGRDTQRSVSGSSGGGLCHSPDEKRYGQTRKPQSALDASAARRLSKPHADRGQVWHQATVPGNAGSTQNCHKERRHDRNPESSTDEAPPTTWGKIEWIKARQFIEARKKAIFDATINEETETAVKLMLELSDSWQAKAWAVKKTAQESKGRRTAGIDGVKSPNDKQKMQMATELTIEHPHSSVLRRMMPKPGKEETRPLGIPNLIDRALQTLLAEVIEPYAEALYSPRQYGYRRGRSAQDAIEYLERRLRKTGPTLVLEVDIEKFFDRINHEALLQMIPPAPRIKESVRRILQAGAIANGKYISTIEGTPQGGPLSPILANLVMMQMEDYLEAEFRKKYAGQITALGKPALVMYADDAVVLHSDRGVLEWSIGVIDQYLKRFGLNLNTGKTRISHTQNRTTQDEPAGFNFLGFHLQHVWSAERKKGGIRVPYILVTPGKRTVERFLDRLRERCDKLKLSHKQRGALRFKRKMGKTDPVTMMIMDLNYMISGFANYYRKCNAKDTFSTMDHQIFEILMWWAKRRFKKKPWSWIYDRLYTGVERDKGGNPLLRVDGTPRERKWAFKSPFMPADSPHTTLRKLADTQILTHHLVKPEKRYYDYDWCYWQRRTSTRYPGTPTSINIAAYRKQSGKCPICRMPIQLGEHLDQHQQGRLTAIYHHDCFHSYNNGDSLPTSIVDDSNDVLCKPGA